MAIDHATPSFEAKDFTTQANADGNSLNLLSIADSNPFKSNYKPAPSEMLATNSNCYTRDCPRPDVQTVDVDQTQKQWQGQEQNQGQWQRGGDQSTNVNTNVRNDLSSDANANANANSNVRNDVNNSVGLDNRVGVQSNNQNTARGGEGGTGGSGGQVRFNQQINNRSQALGLARSPILVNQCSDLAIQLGGGAGFIHGDIGFMTANQNCMDAILKDAQCTGVESIARANMLTAQSALMFPENTESGRQMQRQMAQATLDLAEKCAGVEITGEKVPAPTQAPPEVSRRDLSELENRTNQKIDRAFYHTQKK